MGLGSKVAAHIKYRSGYKYQLAETYEHQLSSAFLPFLRELSIPITTEFLRLDCTGKLVILIAYAWDGPSGPTFDTPDSMRGSLAHDALYQLIRLGLLPRECRHLADLEFHHILLEDGMDEARAWIWYEGVKNFAAGASLPQAERPILAAP
jgi:hypothetical protein